jgi:tetratricopeptide (TPR) repeat protein
MADVLFMQEDYSAGIEYLVKAVELDRRFAHYWGNMGDKLAGSQQVQEAIAAYEQCFLALPERIDLLKKIGDCHMAAGNLAAAREAYAQLKKQLKREKTASEIPSAPVFEADFIQIVRCR